jgi:hypothetical protein
VGTGDIISSLCSSEFYFVFSVIRSSKSLRCSCVSEVHDLLVSIGGYAVGDVAGGESGEDFGVVWGVGNPRGFAATPFSGGSIGY